MQNKVATKQKTTYFRPISSLAKIQNGADDLKFEKYYEKVYKSNFPENSPILKKKVSSATYSKNYENVASKKIIMDEKIKKKCEKCYFSKEDSFSDKSYYHSTPTDYCKTIVRNNNIYINSLPFEKRTGIDLSASKKMMRNSSSVQNLNTYQKIKKEWVQEFFWKKYNKKTPLKEQKQIRESLIREACETEENDELKMYRSFNSHYNKNLLVLASFKKELSKITNSIEERFQKESKGGADRQNLERQIQAMGIFSKYLSEENSELLLRSQEKDSEIFKKLIFYQKFLTESLLRQNNTGMALMSDVIFKMLSVLYENAITY